ncbi:bem46 [Verticillium alfalfae VaMs.102]|uniref:Bem46 n=1 Tax=Verticillium alfalfae (strain VaMs.102 / ATCC MYA-4576 / FGSC 10136) TaxID=526221 RepID=C9SHI5_VERA1|nr:bem46 [Verticillium alfalfae VaMs.102]EEY18408.1 bem46 [Verticillium alfalfae VaMs.102]
MASSNPPSSNSPTFLEQTASMLSTAGAYLRLPALASTGVAAVLTSLLYFKQKALIYPSHMPPNARTEVPRPSQFGIKDFEELVIPTNDGEKLSAFYIRGPRGNRNSDITYRGYGLSTGEPDESGLYTDAQTAIEYLRARAETSNHKLVVYGQSLGGAVAVKLVSKHQKHGDIAGLVLENTFLSMRKLIPSVIPPARYLTYLCHQVWPTDSVIHNVSVPILFLSGLQDEIVPPNHMRQLYDLATASIKIWKPLPGGDHNSSVLEEGYFEAISDFITSVTGDEKKADRQRL